MSATDMILAAGGGWIVGGRIATTEPNRTIARTVTGFALLFVLDHLRK